jgi:hypothetical protein
MDDASQKKHYKGRTEYETDYIGGNPHLFLFLILPRLFAGEVNLLR